MPENNPPEQKASPRKLKAHEKDRTFQYKMIGNDMIAPSLYYGKTVGHGKYMAGVNKTTGELIRDKDGKPVPYKFI